MFFPSLQYYKASNCSHVSVLIKSLKIWVERFNVHGSRLKSPWPRPGLHGHQNHLGMSRQGRPNWLLASRLRQSSFSYDGWKAWRVNRDECYVSPNGWKRLSWSARAGLNLEPITLD